MGVLNWKRTGNTIALTRWEAGDYRLDGVARQYGAGQCDWTLTYRGVVIGTPLGLSEGKRDAQKHRETAGAGENRPPRAVVDEGPLPTCTHIGDCKAHPDAQGLHDFTPTAVQVFRAVLTEIRTGNRALTAEDIFRMARRMGVDDIRPTAFCGYCDHHMDAHTYNRADRVPCADCPGGVCLRGTDRVG